MDEEVRRYDGSNAQWLRTQNVYDILCKAQERLDEGSDCVLGLIFGLEAGPYHCKWDEHGNQDCKACIEEFLYKPHKNQG